MPFNVPQSPCSLFQSKIVSNEEIASKIVMRRPLSVWTEKFARAFVSEELSHKTYSLWTMEPSNTLFL
jgi:hypothetical protein